jgi:multiple sugar transport system ATP-binding protein
MARIELKDVRKSYGAADVIKGIDLDIAHGEFCVFVGPSGCGKSTLLRMISGLEPISGGDIVIGGEVVNDIPAADRGLAMVFQSYALYPHMTVRQNLSFGLENINTPKAEITKKVDEVSKMLQIDMLLDRRPKDLSGGQRQRVAIGRAVVREPRVFLFDEPLSNLDAELRVDMRGEITALHRRLENTMIYVTHDQVEAMTMADKIVVLRAGHIEQVGSPLELYHKPRNEFVAGFIGSPKMNIFGGAEAQKYGGTKAGIRPEHIDVSMTEGTWKGKVGVAEHLGSDTFIHVHDTGLDDMVTVRITGDISVRHGDTIYLTPQLDQMHKFDAQGLRID